MRSVYAIAKGIPQTQMACDEADIELLLIKAMEHLGKAVKEVLPGGAEEFAGYMPRPAEPLA